MRPWGGVGTQGYNPARTHPFSSTNQIDPDFKPGIMTDQVCHVHIDLGLSRDACGVAMGHVATETIIAGEKKPVITIDFMLELKVPEGQQVDFSQVRQLIYNMRDRGFPVKFASFDGYQCLAQGTKVACLDGVDRPIEALTTPTWIYAWDGVDLVPARAKAARKTGAQVQIVAVTLDNGEVVHCTPTHPFLLRNGHYVEAQTLRRGDSLMPLYQRVSAPPHALVGYEQIRGLTHANHTVLSVAPAGLADVYDIEVPRHNCFALAAGVLVHNSADSIQQFLKRGIQAEVLSVDADMIAYETFKEAIYEGRLDFYKYQPLYDCVKSLVLIRGKKVDHTHSGKKDVSDAVAGVCRTLTERWMVVRKGAAARVMSPVIAGMIHPRRMSVSERSIY
jgi:hypothetical protein